MALFSMKRPLLLLLLIGLILTNMAIHDTDKRSTDRSSPLPDSHDAAGDIRMAAGTTSVHPTTNATTTQGYLQTKNGRIVGNDGSNNVGLFGFDSNNQMVVKVAKAGYDADTAANTNLIFNSSQNVFKIVTTGTVTIPGFTNTVGAGGYAANASSVVVTHNLGYIPGATCYISNSGFYSPFPDQGYTASNPGGFLIDWYQASIDSTTITFYHYSMGTNNSLTYPSQTIKYYLLQETAN